MVIFITAALLLLFYLCAVPIQFALTLRISEHSGFGAATAPFERRFAKRSAVLRAAGQKKHLPWKKFQLDAEKIKYTGCLMKPLRYILRHTHFGGFELRGTVATGDAAHTALICGCIEAAKSAVMPLIPAEKMDVSVRADFSSIYSQLECSGMFSLRAGHIIAGAILFAASIAKRRFILWKSTRSKIS